ncbi:fumarylacetoacetate hydrolase family protein [Nocardioides kongjuensis]|uniref:2-keto-4-pentenoate hydratase/2-oxohepta-3-ene-1,7-dioic acid hydratase in catechol pathway n=1 Tax=Nocardioides kongjuensis TaxID=349522 RepID=A0A852RRU0_9ACTN|nr:fumarylacetoacetate hydrolase family protein [Nocardioides kongjuensis]NYD31956.1 2-keto-4-pentenoate hydratase/2-oxohepta-3-ene-1,7-dioic acid hydratase in catechol pathway [Nocardioides kongjuensis]
MSINIIRIAERWYVEKSARTGTLIDTTARTTAELIADRAAIDLAVAGEEADLPTGGLQAPVTAPCRVVAQMTNFVSHIKDSGLDPETVPLTFFRKTSHSISGPTDDIVKPSHVRFLDYEVEVGLVIGKDLPVGTTLTQEDIADHVAALVVTNDVSARDLQLPKTQFFEAKSYPTFTPVGPRLVVLEPGDWERFEDLRLQLWVNGEVRQDAVVADDMLYKPLEALQGLARFQPLSTGDLVLTGTPGGTALKAPPKPVEIIGALLPPAVKWKAFFKAQARNTSYLADGDLVEIHVATPDGKLDLGRQRTTVRHERATAR